MAWEQLGTKSARQLRSQDYADKLKERFKYHPEIRRIAQCAHTTRISRPCIACSAHTTRISRPLHCMLRSLGRSHRHLPHHLFHAKQERHAMLQAQACTAATLRRLTTLHLAEAQGRQRDTARGAQGSGQGPGASQSANQKPPMSRFTLAPQRKFERKKHVVKQDE